MGKPTGNKTINTLAYIYGHKVLAYICIHLLRKKKKERENERSKRRKKDSKTLTFQYLITP